MPRFRQVLVPSLACLLMVSAIAGYRLLAYAQVPVSVEFLGIVGHNGEWEMTATLERNGDTRELAGPMKMKHVGWCSQDGPLEKSGSLHVKLARLSPSIVAKVQVDGVECDYAGSLIRRLRRCDEVPRPAASADANLDAVVPL